jgi:hypothetical protein
MNRKSLNHNMDREEKDATKSMPNPADFLLGSLQSRVAARIMYEGKALDASEHKRRKQIDTDCAAWIISHKQGPMYWLRNWTRPRTTSGETRDSILSPHSPTSPGQEARAGLTSTVQASIQSRSDRRRSARLPRCSDGLLDVVEGTEYTQDPRNDDVLAGRGLHYLVLSVLPKHRLGWAVRG